jgi:hypothetical protein
MIFTDINVCVLFFTKKMVFQYVHNKPCPLNAVKHS